MMSAITPLPQANLSKHSAWLAELHRRNKGPSTSVGKAADYLKRIEVLNRSHLFSELLQLLPLLFNAFLYFLLAYLQPHHLHQTLLNVWIALAFWGCCSTQDSPTPGSAPAESVPVIGR